LSPRTLNRRRWSAAPARGVDPPDENRCPPVPEAVGLRPEVARLPAAILYSAAATVGLVDSWRRQRDYAGDRIADDGRVAFIEKKPTSASAAVAGLYVG